MGATELYIFVNQRSMKNMNKTLYLLVVLCLFTFLLSSSGCRRNKVVKQTILQPESLRGKDFRTPNLLAELDSINDGETLNITLVHGMGTTHLNAFDQTVEHLALYLELEKQTFVGSYCVTYDSTSDSTITPNLKVYRYAKGLKEVQFTYVHWSPATRMYKDSVKAIDNHKREACANKSGKDYIVNDGFGDFMALLDPEVQIKTFRALEVAFLLRYVDISKNSQIDASQLYGSIKNHGEAKGKNILMSASLGSKLTFEFLSNYVTWLDSTSTHTFGDNGINLASLSDSPHVKIQSLNASQISELSNNLKLDDYIWYQFSNQLVLFEACKYNYLYNMQHMDSKNRKSSGEPLSRDSTTKFMKDFNESAPILSKSSTDFAVQTQKNRHAIRSRTTIISFYDKNDLLGFKIPEKTHDGNEKTAKSVINIQIPIQEKIVLGYFSNPLQAHSGSKFHPYVMHIITNGWDGYTDSLPKPREMKTKIKYKILKMAEITLNKNPK